MNTTDITNLITTNSPLLNLGAAQTVAIVLLASLGSFRAGQLTVRVARWALAL